jgi:SAM-dependent methyltransferase
MPNPAETKPLFAHLEWQSDRMLSDGYVYRIQHKKDDLWDLGDECFAFYKVKGLVDQYETFFQTLPGFHPQRVFELGIWDGGSVAFWFDAFRPQKHVAADITQRQDSAYFTRYLQAKKITEKVRTFWGVDQGDTARLDAIVKAEFDGPLDLVIDDASHLYEPTLASFQTLFPRLRPGGLYIIEDWAWDHWPEFQKPDHIWAKRESLTKLVRQLTECVGTRNSPIARLTVHHGFVVAERGYAPLDAATFDLEKYISRRAR